MPESELPETIKLVMLKGQAFRVTIETMNQDEFGAELYG